MRGSQSRSGSCGEEKILYLLPEIEPIPRPCKMCLIEIVLHCARGSTTGTAKSIKIVTYLNTSHEPIIIFNLLLVLHSCMYYFLV
jgi:hypothetical protein